MKKVSHFGNSIPVALTTIPVHIEELEQHLAPKALEPVTAKEEMKYKEKAKEQSTQFERDNEIYEKLQSEGEGEENADEMTEGTQKAGMCNGLSRL